MSLSTHTSSSFKCPECKTLVDIVPHSKYLFVRAFAIENLLKLLASPICRICGADGDSCCVDCEIMLCRGCAGRHIERKYSTHAVELFEEYKGRYCIEHKMKRVYFCREERVMLCLRCLTTHSQHDYVELEQVESCFSSEIKNAEQALVKIYSYLQYSTNFTDRKDLLSVIFILLSQNNKIKFLQYAADLNLSNFSENLPPESPAPDLFYIKRNTESVYSYNLITPKLLLHKSKTRFSKWSSLTLLPNNFILCAGGKATKNNGSKKDLLILDQNLSKIFDSLMIHGHSSHPALLHRETVYIIGGKDEDNITGSHCETFNINTLKSASISSMKHGRTCPAGVVIQDFLYVFGGYTDGISNSIEKYVIDENVWIDLMVVTPVRLFQAGAAVVDEKQILIYGGEISQEFNNTHSFIFNIETQKFGMCSKMRYTDTWYGSWYYSTLFGGHVYTLSSDTVLSYNTYSNNWDSTGPLQIS